jgi:ABC-2 type transport system permease protein
MFLEIFTFEIRQALKRPSTYIFFSIYFILHLLLALAASGVLPLGSSDSNSYINSPVANAAIYLVFNQNIFALIHNIIIIAIMATAVQRDFEYNTHSLFFTKPITKASYFMGRYFGVLVVALLVFSGQMLGHFAGCVIGMGHPTVGPMSFSNFFWPFVMFVVPNTFLFGTIYFSLTTFTRSTMPAYLFTIIFFLFDLASGSILDDIEYQSLAALLDPYGNKALNKITQYWTPDEQNVRMLSLTAELLYNRLIWFGFALGMLLFGYYRFSFSQFLNPVKIFSFRKKKQETAEEGAQRHFVEIPKVSIQTSGFMVLLNQVFYITGFEFKKLVRSYFFIIMNVLSAVLSYFLNDFDSLIFGTEVYPVTYNIADQVGGMFRFDLIIMVIFFSGNLIFAEKQYKVDEFIGASPVRSFTLTLGKYFAVIMTVAAGLFLAMLTGIVIQSMNGYYHYEIGQYLHTLFGRVFIDLCMFTAACFIIQLVSVNKYVGFVTSFVILVILRFILGRLEFTNPMYLFNANGPMTPYSDMNAYGHTNGIYYLFKLYWLSLLVILFAVGMRFYLRGKEKGLGARFRFSKNDSNGPLKIGATISLLVFLVAGSYIFYNLKVLNKIESETEREKKTADFEKKYKRFEKTLQPRIVSSYVEVDLFPYELGARLKGYYYVKNKHNKPLDTLLILHGEETDLKKLEIGMAGRFVINDTTMGAKVYKLDKSLAPGDSIKLGFDIDYFAKGFSNEPKTDVVYNGTFINSSLLPLVGYDDRIELTENSARKKYGLKPKQRMARIDDTAAYANTYISKDADWINFECIVSTVPDQVAVAPGYLIKEYEKDGRRYFHYKMDCPILNFYSFLSARYEVKRDKYKNINIEVFYHPGHEYNIDRMISSVKKSLEYYEKSFSPYQHRQVRILEFPRYESFAQSFPNTIPYSESIGFIAKVDDSDPLSIDYPYYITAHEVGHQWWAHQVIGADVQGATLMSESMAEYSAMMVMEHRFGKEAMHKFLKYNLNRYLIGRAQEKKKELPIMLGENQQYIHYNKGCLVMYALKDYIGEDSVNSALKRYIKKVGFQSAPYTTSKEFVSNMRLSAPDSMQYLIKDLFEDITVYENYVSDLSYTRQADGKYKVKLTVGLAKFKADTLGKSKPVDVNDWVDVGIFSEKTENGKKIDKVIMLKKVKMDKPVKTFEFTTDVEPKSAGIDPYNKLIDRIPENNRCKFGSKPKPPDLNANSGNVSITLG